MEQGDSVKMSQEQYPSPTMQQADVYPTYSNQPPASHSQAPTAPMHSGSTDVRQYPQEYDQPQPSTPQQLAQQAQNLSQNNGQNVTDASKKTKVSRACDECRRKKIKCDADSEAPGTRCSACRRSETLCQFSRAPQKRGPSKGYIKELAERVHLLENRTGVDSSPFQQGFPDVNAYSPSPDFLSSENRKRTHSTAEASQAFPDGPEQLQQFAKGYMPSISSAAGQEGQFPYSIADPSRSLSVDLAQLGTEPIDEYYRELHTYFPILANARQQVESNLHHVRASVRDALNTSIAAAIQASTAPSDPKILNLAAELILQLQKENPQRRSILENVMYLQALLFVIIAEEASGPGSNVGLTWYGVAFTIATYLGLHRNEEVQKQDTRDVIALKTNGRRAYLILVMLDRWHAASLALPFHIGDDCAWLLPSDHKLLGDSAYHLIRLSFCLGHLSEAVMAGRPRINADGPSDVLVARIIRGELERFREGTEQSFATLRHVHLAYLHVKLLSDRHLEVNTSNTPKIIAGAFRIISLLSTEQNRASLLTHHFAALSAITLAEIIERDPEPISLALVNLQVDLDDGQIQHPYIANHARPNWSTAISTFIRAKVEAQNQKTEGAVGHDGLQHLADAAVGADGATLGDQTGKKLEEEAIDWTAMTLEGYLRLFE